MKTGRMGGSAITPVQNRGFTLIEVLVALTIMAVALVAVLKTNVLIEDSLISSKQETTAVVLAASLMSEIQRKGVQEWMLSEGDFEKYGSDLSWQADIEKTRWKNLYHVLVQVRTSEGKSLDKLEAYMYGTNEEGA